MILICLDKHIEHVFERDLSMILFPIFSLFVLIRFSYMCEVDLLLSFAMGYFEICSKHLICYLIYCILTELREFSKNSSVWSDTCTCLSCYCTVYLIYRTYLCTTILHPVFSIMVLNS